MKSHYYKEVALLILLSIAAAALAADHNFYNLIWEYFKFDKTVFENSVAVIRVIAFGAIILLSIINVWQFLHSEKKIIESLLASVHKIFFKNVNLKDTSKNNIYRITCHKYYAFSWFKTILFSSVYFSVTYIVATSLSANINSISHFWIWTIVAISTFLTLYLYLKITDDWWFQFLFRFFKFKKQRFMKPGRNYLLSYVRYGYESGKENKKNTTIPFEINETNKSYRLFTGKTFCSTKEFEKSLNHHDINDLIKKVSAEMGKNQEKALADIDTFLPLLKNNVSINIQKLKENTAFKTSLNQTEQDNVTKFMDETNTLAWDLFNINNIGHCEHFVGFKISDANNNTWGVVVIDVLSNDKTDFYTFLSINSNEEWLNLFLSSYSELFSRAITRTKNE